MRILRYSIPILLACAAWLLAAQEGYDREKYAADYIRFLVLQLNQWNKEFPQQFYAAVVKPPIDATKLSEAAKAGPGELGDSLQKLAALGSAQNLSSNGEFRAQLEK